MRPRGRRAMRHLIPVALLASACCGAFGQTPAPRVEFDVASVKPSELSKRAGEGSRRENVSIEPGSLTMRNVSLKSAIQWAYNVKEYQVSGPGWLSEERYDILAKATSATDEARLRQMLQTLLADRFKMTLHRETKVFSVYTLIVDKNGALLRPGDPAGKSKLEPDGPSGTTIAVTDMSMGELADLLSSGLTRALGVQEPVVDRTGLEGRYNFTVNGTTFLQKFSDASSAQKLDADAVINAAQEVLQSQLGLKAELRKTPADATIVDHAEKVPVEN